MERAVIFSLLGFVLFRYLENKKSSSCGCTKAITLELPALSVS